MPKTVKSNSHEDQLRLYSVTLPWHPRDPEYGTYESTAWATGPDEAKALVAQEMAEKSYSGCETDAERKAWAEDLVFNTSSQSYVAPVTDQLQASLQELMAGPEGNLDSQAKEDYEAILRLLSKHVKL
ncbi:hypothetical protein [Rhodoferax aquaticus]|uniref:Uncharacterized protein n=1 Tax=Rhodoferax aquaticus TaxID=2527691 RepID=A0A515EV56_9BURK|nr:hypothetical protein [Rhodoferax aquaticus]QDL56433.1 hypothetical protein EXZ61_20990 [Rhodoferax aquaticus]